jgi:hypothetical protein
MSIKFRLTIIREFTVPETAYGEGHDPLTVEQESLQLDGPYAYLEAVGDIGSTDVNKIERIND